MWILLWVTINFNNVFPKMSLRPNNIWQTPGHMISHMMWVWMCCSCVPQVHGESLVRVGDPDEPHPHEHRLWATPRLAQYAGASWPITASLGFQTSHSIMSTLTSLSFSWSQPVTLSNPPSTTGSADTSTFRSSTSKKTSSTLSVPNTFLCQCIFGIS